MPRGNFDLCRSTPLLVLLWRERLLKPGPDVGRNVPVRLNFIQFQHFQWQSELFFLEGDGGTKVMNV